MYSDPKMLELGSTFLLSDHMLARDFVNFNFDSQPSCPDNILDMG
jgi:hypothetical protein